MAFARNVLCRHAALAALCLSLWSAVSPAADLSDDAPQVSVRRDGDLLIVDARMTVAALPEAVWSVLTDFDHMTGFISNLDASRVVAEDGQTLRVEQKGTSRHGPFSIHFASVKRYVLTPYTRITSSLISGTFKKFEGQMDLLPRETGTELQYHGESIPEMWLPPLIGPALVRSEIREQFGELRTEILRRKRIAAAS